MPASVVLYIRLFHIYNLKPIIKCGLPFPLSLSACICVCPKTACPIEQKITKCISWTAKENESYNENNTFLNMINASFQKVKYFTQCFLYVVIKYFYEATHVKRGQLFNKYSNI